MSSQFSNSLSAFIRAGFSALAFGRGKNIVLSIFVLIAQVDALQTSVPVLECDKAAIA